MRQSEQTSSTMSAMKRLLMFGVLALGACRSAHDLDKPPPGYREPPPVPRVKQTFDSKTGRVTHEWSEIAFADRRAVKDGPETKYSAEGQKISEGTWSRGQKRGTWRFWYADGALKSETIYAAPQLTTMTFWHPNGKIAVQGPALDDSRQGHWRVWTQAGLLAEEGPYVGSSRQGTWKIYSDDGTRVTEVVYAKNIRTSAGAPVECEPVWQAGSGPGAPAAVPAAAELPR